MRLEYAILARAAHAGERGTFSILGGGLDTLGATGVPLVVPSLGIVIRLSGTAEEGSRSHQLTVELYGPDGSKLPFEGVIPLQPVDSPVRPDRRIGVNCVVSMFGIQFPTFGRYEFRLVLDGVQEGAIPLRIEEGPQEERVGQ